VDAVLNPDPVQSAFLGESGKLSAADLDRLREVAELAIEVHAARLLGHRPRWNLAPRLGYWLLLLSLLDTGEPDHVRADRVGGDGVWRCYTQRGAGRCVQVGMAGTGGATPAAGAEHPGGYLGCFWNTTTVTDERQFWTRDAEQIADWVLHGRQRAARQRSRPCRGCLFPRMSMDAVSLELGLAPELAGRYRALRATYLGY
jgi:hypothetical protein